MLPSDIISISSAYINVIVGVLFSLKRECSNLLLILNGVKEMKEEIESLNTTISNLELENLSKTEKLLQCENDIKKLSIDNEVLKLHCDLLKKKDSDMSLWYMLGHTGMHLSSFAANQFVRYMTSGYIDLTHLTGMTKTILNIVSVSNVYSRSVPTQVTDVASQLAAAASRNP
jgi:hypothetical protein